jgi:hypothetical protein
MNVNWASHILIETNVIREKIGGRIEGKRKWRKGRKQLQDDFQEKNRYFNLKKKRSLRSHFMLSWLCRKLWNSSKSYQAMN